MRARNFSETRIWLCQVFVVALIYFTVARLSLFLAFEHTNASPVWPPSGIALAAVILWGYRIWPGIMAGAFLSNVAVFLVNQAADVYSILTASFLISLGNSLEALTGAFLFKRLIADRNPFYRVQDVFKLVFIVTVMCLVGSAVGPTAVCGVGIVPWEFYRTVWVTWWLGDVTGVLTLAPLFWAANKHPIAHWSRQRYLEFAFFLLSIYFVNANIFGERFFNMPNYALAHISIPLIVWGAFRFGQFGVGLGIIIMLTIAIQGTLRGFGPFASGTANESLLLLQTFIGIITTTGLSLAAALNERKSFEEDLRRSQERFSGIYNSSKDAIGYFNRSGRLLDVNEAFVRLTGYSKAELLSGKTFRDITVPEYHDFEEKKISELLRTGDSIEYEKEYIKKDGLRVPVLLTTFLVRGLDGKITGTASIVKDMTEQKKASEEQFRLAAIVESSGEAIIGKTLEGVITSWNQGAQRLYGYSPNEVIGKSVSILIPPDRSEEFTQILGRLKKGERIEQFETVRMDKWGRQIDVSLTVSPIKESNGKVVGASTITHNITEHKRAEQHMQEAIKIKSEFTSTVSHELRTPLAIAKEALSLLLREKMGKISEKQKEVASIANSNLDRLGMLINDILDFSKIEAGKMEFHKESLDVIPIVKNCCEEWKLQANVKKIKLELIVPNNPIPLWIDKIRFLQILTNLINNAVKFTPEHGKIEVCVEDKEDVCLFSVRDTGPGIAEPDLPKLFQKFQQIRRSHGPGAQGTGLGLSIMKSLVELHGGRVAVESQLNQGTTFRFTIPKVKVDHEQGVTYAV